MANAMPYMAAIARLSSTQERLQIMATSKSERSMIPPEITYEQALAACDQIVALMRYENYQDHQAGDISDARRNIAIGIALSLKEIVQEQQRK